MGMASSTCCSCPSDLSFSSITRSLFPSATRNQYLSTMFESLGHIVHHIEDMAQPQHTRNDTHAHYNGVPLILTPGGFYEVYTAAVGLPTQQSVDALVQPPNNYAPPNFATAREYWYAPGNYPTYRGMAEFTAENFVSQGTEFIRSSSTTIYPPLGFPYPNGTSKAIQAFTDTVTYPSGTTYSGSVDYVVGSIYDGNTGQALPPHRVAASSLLSIWTRPRNVTTGGTYTDAAGTHPTSDMSSINPFLFDVN